MPRRLEHRLKALESQRDVTLPRPGPTLFRHEVDGKVDATVEELYAQWDLEHPDDQIGDRQPIVVTCVTPRPRPDDPRR